MTNRTGPLGAASTVSPTELPADSGVASGRLAASGQLEKNLGYVPLTVNDLLLAAGIMGVLLLWIAWRTLFVPPDRMLGVEGSDVSAQFMIWRQYGFSRLLHGELPLWNPMVFGGQPYLGNWQTALLYPLNWITVLLPAGRAYTLEGLVHVWLCGVFAWLWVRGKGVGRFASTVGGATFMLAAQISSRVYAGHLPWVCVIAWSPLLMLCLDRLLSKAGFRWAWVGAGAVMMQCLAGYPQPFYYTFLFALFYYLLSVRSAAAPGRALVGMTLAYCVGVGLSAMQTLPGLSASGESVRQLGNDFNFATTFAMPPATLLTLIAPRTFGWGPREYTGLWNLHETWPYFGAVSLVLAVVGVVCSRTPSAKRLGVLSLVALAAAMGSATPVFKVFYDFVPGFGQFRAPGRLLLISTLFGAALAGLGTQYLVILGQRVPAGLTGLGYRRTTWLRWTAVGVLLCAAAAAACGWMLRANWIAQQVAESAAQHGGDPGKMPPRVLHEQLQAGNSLLKAGSLLGVCGGLLAVAAGGGNHGRRWPGFALGIAAVAELVWVMGPMLRTAEHFDAAPSPAMLTALGKLGTDERVIIREDAKANIGMTSGFPSLCGYDPFQNARWAEFMAATQGWDWRTTRYVPASLKPHPAWSVLRAGLVIDKQGPPIKLSGALPRALLVEDVRVIADKTERLKAVTDPTFDPRHTVIVERDLPGMADLKAGESALPPGSASIVSDKIERVTFTVRATRPAVLVVTDVYSNGWSALRSEDGSPLEVFPADHLIRGVVVPAGDSTVVMTYVPVGWRAGRVVSALSLLAWIGWGLGLRLTGERKPPAV